MEENFSQNSWQVLQVWPVFFGALGVKERRIWVTCPKVLIKGGEKPALQARVSNRREKMDHSDKKRQE